jgi:hypothetical protein
VKIKPDGTIEQRGPGSICNGTALPLLAKAGREERNETGGVTRMDLTFGTRMLTGAIVVLTIAISVGCKPSDKAGGAANADSAASRAQSPASQ